MPENQERTSASIASAAKSSRWIIATQAFRLGVRICGTVSLARLLSPSDYGVFGMASAVHGFGYVFQDFGLSTVTIRKPELSNGEKNALFWLNALLGSALALAMVPLGFAFSAFFRERTLRLLIPAVGLTFFVNGLHAQLRAQLARDHRFGDLNLIEIGSFTASTAAAIALAWAGAGVWALAALMFVAELGICAGVWARQPWRPSAPLKLDFRGHLLLAGIGLSANDMLRFLQRNADQFLIGRWLGAGPLGIYGRGAQIALLPVIYVFDPLTSLAVSTLRHLLGTPAEARLFWRRILGDLSWIALPAAAVFASMPREIVVVGLGERWRGAAPVLTWLALGVAVLPLQMAFGWLFLAMGGIRRLLACSGLCSLLVVAACLAARGGGIGGIAAGVGLALASGAVIGAVFLGPRDPVRRLDALEAVSAPLAASAVLAAAILGLLRLLPAAGDATRLLCGLAVCALWAGTIVMGFPGVRRQWAGHFLWTGRRERPVGG